MSQPNSQPDSSPNHKAAPPIPISPNASRDLLNFLQTHRPASFNLQNELYSHNPTAPAFTRLDKQHIMLSLALSGHYVAPDAVRRALAPEIKKQKAVLDIGAGNRSWAISMALEFPHAEVVGLELNPGTSCPTPPNCRFETDNLIFGISHYHGCFDVVHARSIGNGFADYRALIDEMVKCLRPGGVLLLAEGDLDLKGKDGESLFPAYDGDEVGRASWFRRILYEVQQTYYERGITPECPEVMKSGLGYHPGLETTGARVLLTPCGPWKLGPDGTHDAGLEMLGKLMCQNSFEFVRAWRPLLFSQGFSLDEIDDWIIKTDNELVTMNPRIHVQWRYLSGIKKANPPIF